MLLNSSRCGFTLQYFTEDIRDTLFLADIDADLVDETKEQLIALDSAAN